SCAEPDWCSGADLDHSGQVGWGDFGIFAAHWLECAGPGCVPEMTWYVEPECVPEAGQEQGHFFAAEDQTRFTITVEGQYIHFDDMIKANCCKDYFELEHRLDTTMDYYMTSVLEPTHFGTHRFKWNVKRIVMAVLFLLTDYCWQQRIIWYSSSIWMWQFDKNNIENSDMVHWWLTFKHVANTDAVSS
ncbi:hypothetical protein LCGC14_2236980, partial [marine sediment metagenome]